MKKVLILKCLLVSIISLGFIKSQAQKFGFNDSRDSIIVLSGQKVKYYPFSEDKKNEQYFSYYFPEMTFPNAEIPRIVSKGPFDYQSALPDKDFNTLLNLGYQKIETGYTLFPDGSGMICALTVMPGVTADMIDWWFAWHPLESPRYRIWDPKVHLEVKITERDRNRLQDSSIPYKQRSWGTINWVTEDVGLGMSTLKISFMSPKDFGFDMSRFKDPQVATAICATITEEKTGLSGKFVHFVRNVPGGIEMRSRFYFDKGVPMALLKGLNYHCIEEYTNLAKILPQVYKDFAL